jgi:glycosyltransferase involved in cell wall biosynthesis
VRRAIVVCLGSIDWTFNWQIPQEVVTGLAAAGHRVLYIENTGVRRPGFRDRARLGARLKNWFQAGGRIRPIAERLDLYSPVLLPLPYSRLACLLNSRALRRVVRRWIGSDCGDPVIFITFLPTPLARGLSRTLWPALVVYYCADRLSESSVSARPVLDHERTFLAEADLVFATSRGLLDRASRLTPRALLLTSGVRSKDFSQRLPANALPPPLRHLRRPIVGYVGSLRNELDLALLASVARLAPDLTFVLVGPIVADVSTLGLCPNVILPGAVPHAEAVRYMLGFDVGVLPYRINSYTTDLLPVKLKEYLAAGLPIVSTGLPQVREFVAEHGPLVTFADTAEVFVAALRAALTSNRPDAVDRRTSVARKYDWSERIASMTDVIEAELERRAPTRTAVESTA